MASETEAAERSPSEPVRPGFVRRLEDQFGFVQLVRDYLIPVETNSIWYLLGGVLAIALGLEIFTGFLLSLVYTPDAGLAYGNVDHLLHTFGWSTVINFHYYTAYLIFGLVMIHMVRVFITGGYRRGKEGLWLVGVGLAGLTFAVSVTGETLHWDEVGFAVPWHVSEFFQAIGLADAFGYTFAALLAVPTATEKLAQIYALHVSIVPILLGLFIGWHYLLIRFKGISVPFWLRPSGRTAGFSEHIRGWLLWSGIILGAVLLISILLPRDPGTAPQLLPSSPLYGAEHGPGGLGYKPTFPISWTHGMNVFVAEKLGIEPDIWGTVVGMALMLGALLVIPFVDRAEHEPASPAAAFDWRKRGWAFLAMGVFWLVMIVGVVQNAVAEAG
ncbi:MAG TPA: cytochrome b N-terminal domain-containing protein [Candidatus Limnocylindrales bacterium]|nr:cytochrome b N-terminal domain-containing protein [Candidatus Limnocylindrales bacterium]